jgi:hypothetical protein
MIEKGRKRERETETDIKTVNVIPPILKIKVWLMLSVFVKNVNFKRFFKNFL